MRALVIDRFGDVPEVREVPDPVPPAGGVIVRVEATGLCRSDWHAVSGHDDDVRLPHVPGHEFAGTVAEVGAGVDAGLVGDRVTAPFVQACGACALCVAGDQQVCARQVQPGFTTAGAFAEYVVVQQAAVNLVPLPDAVGAESAALLGCRVGTSFRALTAVGRLQAGEWVSVFGCGGVGLAAVMIASAAGARVLAVDVDPAALDLATRFGAAATLDSAHLAPGHGPGTGAGGDPGGGPGGGPDDVASAVRDLTGGGAHLSLDALGSAHTCAASIAGLRARGRHVQVGLLPRAVGLPGQNGLPPVPMDLVVARELEVLGSHGMPSHAYPQLLALVASGRVDPALLVTARLTLADAGPALLAMGTGGGTGGGAGGVAVGGAGVAVADPRT